MHAVFFSKHYIVNLHQAAICFLQIQTKCNQRGYGFSTAMSEGMLLQFGTLVYCFHLICISLTNNICGTTNI